VAGQAAGGCTAVHPGQLEGHQRQGQVLGPGDEPAVFRVEGGSGDAGVIEGLQEGVLGLGPLVAVALSSGHQSGDRPSGHGPCRLYQHLQVVALGEAPHDLPDIVAGQGVERGHGHPP